MNEETKGIWFAAYGSVYSLLDDGTVVRIALMDRNTDKTTPTERDANVFYIVGLQNTLIGRSISEEDLRNLTW